MSLCTLVLLATLFFPGMPGSDPPAQDPLTPPATAPQTAPALINGSLDCGGGYHVQEGVNGLVPNGWTAILANAGTPYLTSTQLWGRGGSCDPNEPWWKWEKIEGHDSFMFMGGYAPLGQDFPSPPFDATLYQRVRVTPGAGYSLSAWLMSLCGGSAMPNDCPAGQYIAKLVGLDLTGNTNPDAATVIWIEDRRPHYESRWVDFSPAGRAQGEYVTVFLRARSPFTHHGNHVFADGVQLVRAPAATFAEVRHGSDAIVVRWQGDLGEDIRGIPAGMYRLYSTVQYQRDAQMGWQNWLSGVTTESALFPTPRSCRDVTYRFRVRVTAEQPTGETGAWPPHRFEGLWQESEPVSVAPAFECNYKTWLPRVVSQ